MPPDPAKAAPTPAPDRVFTSIQHVGPFPQGHVFNETEFKRLHPLPEGKTNSAYHPALLQRLINLGAIAETPEAKVLPTPVGPLNRTASDSTDVFVPPPVPVKK